MVGARRGDHALVLAHALEEIGADLGVAAQPVDRDGFPDVVEEARADGEPDVFAELAGDARGALGSPEPNIVVIRSLTKTWALPGARIGFACGHPGLLARLRAELGAWPLSCFAEAIAIRALAELRRHPDAVAEHWTAVLVDVLQGQVRWEDVAAALGPPLERGS